jgi:hypothetical protein
MSFDIVARVLSRTMSRIAAVHKPLYGHTSPETAYMVDDYPYGRTLRCRIRYWLESGGKKGFRFVSQTEEPRTKRWNNPKKSTYASLAAAMYLDEQNHCVWRALSEYDKGSQVLDFVKDFPHADFSLLKPYAAKKIKYLELLSGGKIEWRVTVNGQPSEKSQQEKEEDMGRAAKELESWQEIEKHLH